MIELKTAELAIGLVGNVDEKHVLGTVAGTATAEIASSLSVDGVDDAFTPEALVEYVNGVEDHTVQMTQVKDLAVASIRQLTDLIRNKINPHIQRVSKLSSLIESSVPALPFKVVSRERPAFLQTQLASEMLAAWVTLGENSDGKTMGKGIGTYDEETLVGLLEGVLPITDNRQKALDELNWILGGTTEASTFGNDERLFQALVIIHKSEIPQPGVMLSLDAWKYNRNVLGGVIARALNGTIKRFNSSEATQSLYLSAPNERKEIIVNKVVYKTFLESGLTVEALIGNEILGRRFMPHQIRSAEAIEICEKAYNEEVRLNKHKAELETQAFKIRRMTEILIEDVDDVFEKNGHVVDGDDIVKARGRVREVASKVLSHDSIRNERVEDLVAAILLAVWYAHTDAARLIDIACRIAETSPELDAEEVYTLAKIEYISVYVARQLALKPAE